MVAKIFYPFIMENLLFLRSLTGCFCRYLLTFSACQDSSCQCSCPCKKMLAWQIWKCLWQCGCIWNHKFFLHWRFPPRWTLADCHQDRFLLLIWNMIIPAKIFCQLLKFLVLCLSCCVNNPICIKVGYRLEFLKFTLSRKGFPDSVFTECKSSFLVGSWLLPQFPD